MNNNNDALDNPGTGSGGSDKHVRQNTDLPDSQHDKERLQPESFTIDLPDVKDIPGQENITPLSLGELADTTISSADEEGEGLFGDDDEDDDSDLSAGTDADVTKEEKELLKRADEDVPTIDDANLHKAALDNTDMEGDELNEGSFGEDVSGEDLDTPGTADDDADEEIGEEDEENNSYSLGSDDNADAAEDEL